MDNNEYESRVAKLIGEDVSAPKEDEEYKPVYKVIGTSKIPVSKHRGKLWKSRRDAGHKFTEKFRDSAQEAICYYRHDQHGGKGSLSALGAVTGGASANRRNNNRETENIVYSNTTSLVPMLYFKNPNTEITPFDEDDQIILKQADMYEKVVNAMFAKKEAPGINLKPKAKRAVLSTLLTNKAWALIGYNKKAQSNQQVLSEIEKLSKSLEEAKDLKEIRRIEGELQVLENKVEIVGNEGVWLKILRYDQVIVDPDSDETAGIPANWKMHYEYISTDYLNAEFAEKNEDGAYVSIYQPTHIMCTASAESEDVDTDGFGYNSISNDKELSKYGYDSKDAYNKARRTKVWYVWDLTTRRLEMYEDSNWDWPIWVWDDPYRLEGFYPYSLLEFVQDPDGSNAKGEVVYYLDQQDAINEINEEEANARANAFRNFWYNADIIKEQDTIDKVLKGADGTAAGIKGIPDGMKISDLFGSIPVPSLQFKELFNKEGKYAAIDRISSVNEIVRGGQFKTNTTNDQANTITDVNGLRLDHKKDAIEDWVGDIGWKGLQLLVQFADRSSIAKLVGNRIAKEWKNMEPDEFITTFSARVIGGTTDKPTSRAKKQEAVEVGQVLGQFAKASPVVVEVMLELFQQAFDEIIISDDRWQRIRDSIAQQSQQMMGTTPATEGQPDIEALVQQAVAEGVPEEVARQKIAEKLNVQ